MATLLSISEELRILIIEECMNLPSELTIETLRRLRLTHSKFASNKILNNLLFSTLAIKTLMPTETLKRLAPYVREVILDNDRSSDPEVILDNNPTFKYTVLRHPQNGDTAPDRFKHSAEGHMAPALRILTNTQHIRISNKTYHGLGPRALLKMNAYEKTPWLDDPLFRCAISSIVHAEMNLLGLYIEHAAHHNFQWATCIPEIQNLDLPNLETLHFHPKYIPRSTLESHRLNRNSVGGALSHIQEPDATLTTLLRKCSSSRLKHLSLRNPAFIFGESWKKSVPPPDFPVLTSLTIESGCVHWEHFTPWFHHCTSLQRLTLKSMDLVPSAGGRGFVLWRPLFDAIRNHPNLHRMHVRLERLWCDMPANQKHLFLTLDPSMEEAMEDVAGDRNNVQHLRRYIVGKQDWATTQQGIEAIVAKDDL